MNADTTEDQLDHNLVVIWKTLQAAQDGSSRFIEGLIAEIRDEEFAPEQRIASVGNAWWPFVREGRGIFDCLLYTSPSPRD